MGRLFAAVTIKRIVFSWIAAYVLSYTFLRVVSPDEASPLTSALWGVAAFIVAGIMLGTVNTLGWLLYLWIGKGDDFDQLLLQDLRAQRVIAPRRGQPRTFDYLAVLADDKTADPDERVKAAALFGSYSALINRAGVFGGLAWRKAADRAVLLYSQERPGE